MFNIEYEIPRKTNGYVSRRPISVKGFEEIILDHHYVYSRRPIWIKRFVTSVILKSALSFFSYQKKSSH